MTFVVSYMFLIPYRTCWYKKFGLKTKSTKTARKFFMLKVVNHHCIVGLFIEMILVSTTRMSLTIGERRVLYL
jgi:hypothetical protein